jgi:hypothetical protein
MTTGKPAGSSAVLDDAHLGDIEGALGRIRVGELDDERRSIRRRLLTFLAIMGPGIIVMVGDNDAGGVATYDLRRAGRPIREPPRQLFFPGVRPTAAIAGATASHRPMVTTMAVRYPNGRIPTSLPTMPAKTIKSQALTKNSGPAAMSLKNASTINHLRFPGSPQSPAAGQVAIVP